MAEIEKINFGEYYRQEINGLYLPESAINWRNYVNEEDEARVGAMFADPEMQERIEGYYKKDYPEKNWLDPVVPSPESVLETIGLMRAKGLTATVVLPCKNEKENVGHTVRHMRHFTELGVGDVVVVDNSDWKDGGVTREVIRNSGAPLIEAEQAAKTYGIPEKIQRQPNEYDTILPTDTQEEIESKKNYNLIHKGTNMLFSILNKCEDLGLDTDAWKKHYMLFIDSDAGLGSIEALQLLHAFAKNPNVLLTLPYVPRLTMSGDESGQKRGGGRVSKLAWGPTKDASLDGAARELPPQLAGVYGVRLDYLAQIQEWPHAFGVETGIQAMLMFLYDEMPDIIKYVPCGIYSQVGQRDANIRLMAHDVIEEADDRIHPLKHERALKEAYNANIAKWKANGMNNAQIAMCMQDIAYALEKEYDLDPALEIPGYPGIKKKQYKVFDTIWTVQGNEIVDLQEIESQRVMFKFPSAMEILMRFYGIHLK
jgi:hypothetical protein